MPLFTAQVIIGTTPTQIIANLSRTAATFQNESDQDVYIGDPTVSVTTGFKLVPKASYTTERPDAFYGVVASGTALITYLKE